MTYKEDLRSLEKINKTKKRLKVNCNDNKIKTKNLDKIIRRDLICFSHVYVFYFWFDFSNTNLNKLNRKNSFIFIKISKI